MPTKIRPLSRRRLLRNGAAAAAGGAALWSAAPAAAQSGRAPAVVTARRFRAWIGRGEGTTRTKLEEVTLKPISGRQVVVRTEATNLCYSNVPPVLGIQPARQRPRHRRRRWPRRTARAG